VDKAPLVEPDLRTGVEFLEALDEAKLDVRVALWVYPAEYEEWRLFLASPVFDEDISEQYGLVRNAFRTAGIPIEHQPSLMIRKMSDPFVKELRRTYLKWKHLEGERMGSRSFGGIWIEEGIIYRIR